MHNKAWFFGLAIVNQKVLNAKDYKLKTLDMDKDTDLLTMDFLVTSSLSLWN